MRHQARAAVRRPRSRHGVVGGTARSTAARWRLLRRPASPRSTRRSRPMPEGFRHVAFGDLEALSSACDPSDGRGGVPRGDRGRGRRRRRCRRAISPRCREHMRRTADPAHARRGADRPRAHRTVVRLPARGHRARRRHDGQGARQRRAGRRVLGATDEVAAAFAPGDHGSTFGGQPLAMSAARATLETMMRDRRSRPCSGHAGQLTGAVSELAGSSRCAGWAACSGGAREGLDAAAVVCRGACAAVSSSTPRRRASSGSRRRSSSPTSRLRRGRRHPRRRC